MPTGGLSLLGWAWVSATGKMMWGENVYAVSHDAGSGIYVVSVQTQPRACLLPFPTLHNDQGTTYGYCNAKVAGVTGFDVYTYPVVGKGPADNDFFVMFVGA